MSNSSREVLVSIGKAIRDLRLEKKISQEDLALLAEVDRSYMGQIERGEGNATVLMLHKIANALDVSFEALLARVEL